VAVMTETSEVALTSAIRKPMPGGTAIFNA
jgi:hypothetical protein